MFVWQSNTRHANSCHDSDSWFRMEIIAGQRHDQEIHVGTIVHEHREVFIQLKQNADKTITGVGDALKSFVHGDLIDGLEEL